MEDKITTAEEGTKAPEKAKKSHHLGIKSSKAAKTEKAPKSKTEKTKTAKPKSEKPKSTPKKKQSDTPKEKKPSSIKRLTTKYIGGLIFSRMAKNGAKELTHNAEEVNKLNVFPVPDGDTGDNMRMTIEGGIAALEGIETDNLSEAIKVLSRGMLLGARGNSGVIVSQFFAGIAKGLENVKRADAAAFGRALEMGVQQAYSSVMTPTEGTILTVAREAVEYAVARIDENSTIRSLFADLTREMHASVERTPEILPVLKDAGVVDSGGAGLFYIIDGFNRALNGDELPDNDEPKNATRVASPTEFAFNEDSVMTYAYCTECLLQLQRSKCDPATFDVEAFKEFLISMGDSVVCFITGSIVKLHVHTFTPEKVMARCREYDEFLTIKIENMSVQHNDTIAEEKSDSAPSATSAFTVPDSIPEKKNDTPKKKNAIVSVSNGAGVEALFAEFGVDATVQGGQTQNPSTNDFIDAFKGINAENIFVLPNNGNIFMAAQQAGELYEDAKVYVIPSKNIGMGYVALTSIDFENLEPEAILAEAEEAMKRVTTGYVSPAIRDADMNGVHITNGDTIGIIDKEIVLSDADFTAATNSLADKLLAIDGKFMLTIFVGADATEEARTNLESYLAEAHPDAEVYFIQGDQQTYPFIFAAE